METCDPRRVKILSKLLKEGRTHCPPAWSVNKERSKKVQPAAMGVSQLKDDIISLENGISNAERETFRHPKGGAEMR